MPLKLLVTEVWGMAGQLSDLQLSGCLAFIYLIICVIPRREPHLEQGPGPSPDLALNIFFLQYKFFGQSLATKLVVA